MKDVLKDCIKRDKRKQLKEDIFMGALFILALAAAADIYTKL